MAFRVEDQPREILGDDVWAASRLQKGVRWYEVSKVPGQPMSAQRTLLATVLELTTVNLDGLSESCRYLVPSASPSPKFPFAVKQKGL